MSHTPGPNHVPQPGAEADREGPTPAEPVADAGRFPGPPTGAQGTSASVELPIRVRRARPDDTRAVLDFARTTWDGWDYIPSVWQTWLDASDGVLLVATPNVQHQLDRFGRLLSADRPVAIARVAILSPEEAWLEGLRVDPGVRTRGVARLVHGACLTWAQAQGARWVRYATGEENEGSHRLGAHHGFRLLRPWRSYAPPRDGLEELEAIDAADQVATDADDFADLADEATGEVPLDVAERATGEWLAEAPVAAGPKGEDAMPGQALAEVLPAGELGSAAEAAAESAGSTVGRTPLTRAIAHRRLRRAGLLLDPRASAEVRHTWWRRVAADPTFALGDHLYEFRNWAFQELTEDRFEAHVRNGDVVVLERAAGQGPGSDQSGGRRHAHPTWALAVLPLEAAIAAAERPWAALLAGDGEVALDLAVATREALRRPLRLRVPDDAPLMAEREGAFLAAGFERSDDTLHLLARELRPDAPIDLGPDGAVTFEEPPRRVAEPPDQS